MFIEAKQAYFNPGYTFLEKPINFKLFLTLALEFIERSCQFKRPRPGATGGGHSGAVSPQMTACAPPNENCAPPSEDCAPKKLSGSGLLECKSRPKDSQIGVYRPYFRNFCGLTPDFIKLLGRRPLLFLFYT